MFRTNGSQPLGYAIMLNGFTKTSQTTAIGRPPAATWLALKKVVQNQQCAKTCVDRKGT